MTSATSQKSSSIQGSFPVPGDKSISHRSLILASQTIGKTIITGLLESEDVLNTAEALQNLGVSIEKNKNNWVVNGVGVGGLKSSEEDLYLGNSGTGARLLMGLVASHPFPTTFTGDESLSKRPMQRVLTPLEEMGTSVQSKHAEKDKGYLPLIVEGNNNMTPISYEMPVASAQVKSAILLAALNVAGRTTVIEKSATRDHTELMMKFLGVDIEVDGNEITIMGQPELHAKDINVPGDPSSAAFFVVAALLVPNSDITIMNICINPLRIGLFKTLNEMGADISYLHEREEAGEKIADINVKYSKLNSVTVPADRAPSMIDEYLILSVAAAFAEGKTKMEGLGELKVKESDRLQAIVDGLTANGVNVTSGDDWIEIDGKPSVPGGGEVKTHMDHRIAMSFLVLGAASDRPVTVDSTDMIATSFPSFMDLFQQVGGNIK